MRKTKAGLIIGLVLTMILAAFGPACDNENPEDGTGGIGIIVTLLPQAEFVHKIGSDKVEVTVMVPPGADPHIYEPTPSQMIAVDKAQIYAKVGSGVEFELAWLDKILAQNKSISVIDCSENIDLIGQKEGELEGETHEHEGETDPHIWMSPLNARVMVENICSGLVEIDPDNRVFYETNRDAYLGQLSQLDDDIRQGLSEVKNRTFMVYHPSFGYFAKEYDLTMLTIEEEGKEPTAAGLAKLIRQAKENNIKVIFASPQFNPKTAEEIAGQIGGKVIISDPLARDYIPNMQKLANALAEAME